jgi:hypothetical protein
VTASTDRAQRGVGLERLDQLQPRDIGELDVHDHQPRHELARALDCFAAIGHGFDREAVGDQQVAEQFAVEVVVLDNQNSFCH